MEVQEQDTRKKRPQLSPIFIFIVFLGLAAFFLCLASEFQKAKVDSYAQYLFPKLSILCSKNTNLVIILFFFSGEISEMGWRIMLSTRKSSVQVWNRGSGLCFGWSDHRECCDL